MEPRIQTVLDWFRSQDGTIAANVCGSGACSFALCDSAATAANLAAQQNGWWAYATELVSDTVRIEAPKK